MGEARRDTMLPSILVYSWKKVTFSKKAAIANDATSNVKRKKDEKR